MTKHPRHALRGFTAVEVMISLALFAVGAGGIVAMQLSTAQGIAQARNLDTANAIAHTWVERLRADTTQWTLPNGNDPFANDFASMRFLNQGGTNMTDAGWYLPAQGISVGLSPAFDLLGRDLSYLSSTAGLAPVQFCTHVRVDCLARTNTIGVAATTCSLMRAQVRVFWPKNMANDITDFCTAGVVGQVSDAAHAPLYHWVYVVTALRQNSVR